MSPESHPLGRLGEVEGEGRREEGGREERGGKGKRKKRVQVSTVPSEPTWRDRGSVLHGLPEPLWDLKSALSLPTEVCVLCYFNFKS